MDMRGEKPVTNTEETPAQPPRVKKPNASLSVKTGLKAGDGKYDWTGP
jgi:hypothetical protein